VPIVSGPVQACNGIALPFFTGDGTYKLLSELKLQGKYTAKDTKIFFSACIRAGSTKKKKNNPYSRTNITKKIAAGLSAMSLCVLEYLPSNFGLKVDYPKCFYILSQFLEDNASINQIRTNQQLTRYF
jgi:hypothetical protein